MASPVTQHFQNQGMRYLQWVFQKMDRQVRLKVGFSQVIYHTWNDSCDTGVVELNMSSCWGIPGFMVAIGCPMCYLNSSATAFFDLWRVARCQADVIAHSQGNSPIFIIGFASLNWDEWITAAILIGISSKFNKFALLRIMWITKKWYSLFLHKCISYIRFCISLCLHWLYLLVGWLHSFCGK